MCEYCGDERKLICVDNFGVCKFEMFIEDGEKLAFNTHDHQFNVTEDIFGSWKINFCPMCGERLK